MTKHDTETVELIAGVIWEEHTDYMDRLVAKDVAASIIDALQAAGVSLVRWSDDMEAVPLMTPLLVWAACEGWPGKSARVAAFKDRSGVWRVYGPIMGEPRKNNTPQCYGEVIPTHWAHLPSPPKEG